jgi:hypothetical protein
MYIYSSSPLGRMSASAADRVERRECGIRQAGSRAVPCGRSAAANSASAGTEAGRDITASRLGLRAAAHVAVMRCCWLGGSAGRCCDRKVVVCRLVWCGEGAGCGTVCRIGRWCRVRMLLPAQRQPGADLRGLSRCAGFDPGGSAAQRRYQLHAQRGLAGAAPAEGAGGVPAAAAVAYPGHWPGGQFIGPAAGRAFRALACRRSCRR